MELTESNVVGYLRESGRASAEGEMLVQNLASAGGENVVLKIFDMAAGERIGTDLRTPGQVKSGKPDARASKGECFVLKQPRERDGALDLARIHQEKACIELLGGLLPAGSVPEVRWFDEANGILAMSSPPPEAVVWQKQISTGAVSMDGASLAGMLLAIIHSSTKKDPAAKEKFGDGGVLLRQRIEPIMKVTAAKHPNFAKSLQDAVFRLRSPLALIHGDFRPENILLVPGEAEAPPAPEPGKPRPAGGAGGAKLAHVMLVDFESAYFGHHAFDIATLLTDVLLAGFVSLGRWRAYMLMADNFWQTYRHTADPELVRAAEAAGGRLLGALLLARLDGPTPFAPLADRREAQTRARGLALEILKKNTITLDEAIDEAAMHYDPPQEPDIQHVQHAQPKRNDGGHQGSRRQEGRHGRRDRGRR